MRLTSKQAHVLDNLERVRSLPYKLNVKRPAPRFELDGWNCSTQINSLAVKKLLAHISDGIGLVRL